jgi:hypothetical protein
MESNQYEISLEVEGTSEQVQSLVDVIEASAHSMGLVVEITFP